MRWKVRCDPRNSKLVLTRSFIWSLTNERIRESIFARLPITSLTRKGNLMAHLIGWVDIPVTDLNRAMSFYRTVTAIKIEQEFGPEVPVAVFAHGGDDVSGCLFVDEEIKPSAQGPLLYFSVNGRLDEAVSAVEPNG